MDIINLPNTENPQRQFKLKKKIGKGSEGQVFQYQPLNWKDHTKDIAIKICHYPNQKEYYFTQQLIQYQNQWESDPKLKSQLMRVYEIHPMTDHTIILQELGEGDLSTYLEMNKTKLSFSQKLSILRQVTQPIAYLHKNKLLHRDLKPENYVKFGEEFKLIDFGLIKYHDNNPKTRLVGSPLFQAPEVKNGSSNYSFEVDLWSLACTFIEILQEDQLKLEQLNNKNYQIKATQIVDNEVQNKIRQMTTRMLQQEPYQRGIIDQVLQDLQQIEQLYNNKLGIQQIQNPQNMLFKSNQFQNVQKVQSQNQVILQNMNEQQQNQPQLGKIFQIIEKQSSDIQGILQLLQTRQLSNDSNTTKSGSSNDYSISELKQQISEVQINIERKIDQERINNLENVKSLLNNNQQQYNVPQSQLQQGQPDQLLTMIQQLIKMSQYLFRSMQNLEQNIKTLEEQNKQLSNQIQERNNEKQKIFDQNQQQKNVFEGSLKKHLQTISEQIQALDKNTLINVKEVITKAITDQIHKYKRETLDAITNFETKSNLNFSNLSKDLEIVSKDLEIVVQKHKTKLIKKQQDNQQVKKYDPQKDLLAQVQEQEKQRQKLNQQVLEQQQNIKKK